MTKIVQVKFLRHAPPFMPGDHAWFPETQARALSEKGIATTAISEQTDAAALAPSSAPAPTPRTQIEFDPASSPIDEVRAFLVGHGEQIPDDATEAQCRRAAATLLKKQK